MEATEMNITSLLDHGKSSNTEAAPAVIEDVPLEHLALGTNLEKVPVKDLVRMPGTKWCGIGWRTDTVQQFGGYAGTDRYVQVSWNLDWLIFFLKKLLWVPMESQIRHLWPR